MRLFCHWLFTNVCSYLLSSGRPSFCANKTMPIFSENKLPASLHLPSNSLAGSVPSLNYCESLQTLEVEKVEGKKQLRRGKRESLWWMDLCMIQAVQRYEELQ